LQTHFSQNTLKELLSKLLAGQESREKVFKQSSSETMNGHSSREEQLWVSSSTSTAGFKKASENMQGASNHRFKSPFTFGKCDLLL